MIVLGLILKRDRKIVSKINGTALLKDSGGFPTLKINIAAPRGAHVVGGPHPCADARPDDPLSQHNCHVDEVQLLQPIAAFKGLAVRPQICERGEGGCGCN